MNKIFNYTETLEAIITILPGLAMILITHNHVWFSICFWSICSVMPFRRSYYSLKECLIHLIIIFALSIIFFYLFPTHLYYSLGLILLSSILGYLEFYNNWTKSAINYVFIGVIYSSLKVFPATITLNYLLKVFLLSGVSIILGLTFTKKRNHCLNNSFTFKYDYKHILYYFKYTLPISISLCIGFLFKIKEMEWLIWSALSVYNLDYSESLKKLLMRFQGGLIGVAIGLLLVKINRTDSFEITTICCVFTLITLRAFKSYFIAFTVRCLLIVLYANNYTINIGVWRIMDIFLGGAIGYSVVLFVHFLNTIKIKNLYHFH